MNIKVKNLFNYWLQSLNIEELNSTDKKLLNIFSSNLENIYPLGLQGNNKRSDFIINIIKEERAEIEELTFGEAEGQTSESQDFQFGHIDKLEVESFRGFKAKESFEFSKNYNIVFGKNGTGKSSFFEALEYVLLGNIEEAGKRGFDITKYIINADTGKVLSPKAYYLDRENNNVAIVSDYGKYQWFFVEKNRINDFSRVSANTPGIQTLIISSLFGLDEFNEFVKKFTPNFAINPEDENQKKLEQLTGNLEIHKINKESEDANLKNISEEKNKIYEGYKTSSYYDEKINNCDELLKLINGDAESKGTIENLNEEIIKQQNVITLSIDEIYIETLKKHRDNCVKNIDDYENTQNELSSQVDKINLKELYEAALKVEVWVKDKCPLCLTPTKGFIKKVKKNPYVHSRDQLEKLKEASKLETKKEDLKRTVLRELSNLNNCVNKVNLDNEKTNYKIDFEANYQTIDGLDTTNEIKNKIQSCEQLKNIELEKLKKQISSIKKQNSEKDVAIQKIFDEKKYFENLKTNIEKQDTLYQSAKSRKEVASKAIDEFSEKNKELLNKIKEEQEINKDYEKYKTSYDKLCKLLNEYKDMLPVKLTEGLNERVASYYNTINKHDESRGFEQIEKIELPTKAKDQISIYFKSDPAKKEDALHVLSEGHLKCLGLAMIIAKAVTENVPVLIFDDIVNAIDDDHRSGVRDLLFKHDDIKDKQIILTSHGRSFTKQIVNDIKDCQVPEKCKEICFVLTSERGVTSRSKDTEHHLSKAKKHFEEDSEYECAKECRYALENMIQKIWKKFGNKKMNTALSVVLRYGQDEPDLHSVVNSVYNRIKKLKNEEKDDKFTNIENNLEEILKDNNWKVINNASHYQKWEEEIIEDTAVKKVFDCLMELSKNT